MTFLFLEGFELYLIIDRSVFSDRWGGGRNLGREEEANGKKEWKKESYFFWELTCARDSVINFICISSFNSQDNAVKCHYCKIRFIGEETGSRVLKGQGHLTSRVTQLGYDGAGIRIQLLMTPNPVLQASKMQPWGFLVNPLSLPELWITIPSLLVNTSVRRVGGSSCYSFNILEEIGLWPKYISPC